MPDYIEGRTKTLQALQEELVGPSPQGIEIDCTQQISFDTPQQSYGPWRQKGSGEEILQRDPPTKRYGIGVLYPLLMTPEDNQEQNSDLFFSSTEEDAEDIVIQSAEKAIEQIEKREVRSSRESEIADIELPVANTTRPSSFGLSFLADIPHNSKLTVEVSGGRYHKYTILVQGQKRTWWLRSPVKIIATFVAKDLYIPKESKIKASKIETNNTEGLDIRVEVFSRPYNDLYKRLLTVCVVNRSERDTLYDQTCLFQTLFTACVTSGQGNRYIYPYPDFTSINKSETTLSLDEEEESLTLLYRTAKTFAVGHGCAADWGLSEKIQQQQQETTGILTEQWGLESVQWVKGECLPIIELPSTTPNVERADGTKVEVDMAPLAGLIPGNDGMSALEEVIILYQKWVERQAQAIPTLDIRYQRAAYLHIEECKHCVQRMRQGLYYSKSNPLAHRAFQLANYAMLLQQVRGGREVRTYHFEPKTVTFTFLPTYSNPDLTHSRGGQGKWRAFQIAFLLMALQSSVDGQSEDRRRVELIWFPTGGGKTEAYLGLAAFAMFMRRLEDCEDAGVQVLMRYTLRLLTAQQFQRASSLLCAMEYIRRRNARELGKREFSIGVWLGNSITPNTRYDAIKILKGLMSNEKDTENKFLLTKCPWCRAQMGPLKLSRTEKTKTPINVLGYMRQGKTVVLHCHDSACEFYKGLPVYVIDEDIYEKRPTMLIGTVDKFALVAWKSEARSIFGINKSGERESSPPNLIIQDELHLISGPLGSMVGLYETLIEELCTDRRRPKAIVPKIISSTATIRRYKEQIQRLYGREEVTLFPPPGLSANDSFFARYAKDEEGNLARGRIYVGVYAPGLGSLQTTQVRSFTALLQAPLSLPEKERDPWWTLLLFFNSLRELGTTLSLFQSDIPDYFYVLKNRTGKDITNLRKFYNILELTGRLKNEEVPEAISRLEVIYESEKQKNHPVDVCLASNIIEVGVDIDRLSLMTVVGQPKTTSQYIQVTGRVGRRPFERPGLVVTLYGTTRPRDRSHYEKFRSYHEQLYAQVEPTSVTPFSPPVLDRALHAIMVAYVRQMGNKDNIRSPYPYPDHLVERVRQILIPRIKAVDPDELPNFQRVFNKRVREWKAWNRSTWEDRTGKESPLIRQAGAYAPAELEQLSWPTASSMRDVDAQCDAIITGIYALYASESEGEQNID